MPKLLKIMAISIAIFVTIFVSGSLYVSSQATKWAKEALQKYGDEIGYEISFDKLNLSVAQLRLEVDGIRIAPKQNKEHLLTIRKSVVDLGWLDFAVKRIRVNQILIDSPDVVLSKDKKNWNWQDFIAAIQKNAGASPQKESGTPFEFLVDEFKLSNGKIDLADNANKFKTQITPLDIDLKKITNMEDDGTIGGLESGYSIRLGSVNIPIPNTGKTIKLDKVKFVGNIDLDSKNNLKLFLNSEIDDGKIDSTTELNAVTGQLSSHIKLHKLSVAPIVSLLPANKPLFSKSGDVTGEFSIHGGKDDWTATGGLAISTLSVYEPDKKNELIGWDISDISGIEVKGGQTKTALTINSIKIVKPKGRLIVYEDKTTNFRRLFSKEAPAPLKDSDSNEKVILPLESVQTSSDNRALLVEQTKQAVPAQFNFVLDVKSIALEKAQFEFTDYGIKPMFQTKIHNFSGTLLGMSNQPNRYASMAFAGRVDKTGEVTFKGQTSFEDPRRNNDVVLAFKKIPLRSVNPYSMTFAGYEIKNGTVSVTLNYKVKEYELKGGNHIVINKIQLGEESPDYKGPSLPLRLAVGLLEDGDGVIDLNIPVSGNINNPKFSLGGLAWQAFTTMLTNIVTAPFRAIGQLLGIENFEGVYFEAGDSALQVSEHEKLEHVATALNKRPKVKLLINGVYDPELDAAQLGRATIDRAIFKAANFKVSPADPIPTLSFADERIQSAIKTVYADRIGRLKLVQKQIGTESAAEKAKILRDELIANEKAGTAQLEMLAKTRAANAMRAMLEIDKSLEPRITTGEIKTSKGSDEGVSLQIEFGNM